MNKPDFGGMFFDEAVKDGAKMYWGARAVINRQRGIEIYRDRQEYTADDETDKEEFFDWLNNGMIPAIEKCVKEYRTGRILTCDKTDRFFAVAEDRNSGGYLYIGAWAL